MVITIQDFKIFIRKILSEGIKLFDEVIVPAHSAYNNNNHLFFTVLKDSDEISDLGEYRTIDPIKILFYSPREKVLPYGYENRRRLILGVKACDISALLFLDQALMNSGFVDPAYNYWRKNTLVISTDCNSLLPNCFCSYTGGAPYPLNGFDMNLTQIDDKYLVKTGSASGEELMNIIKKYITTWESTPDILNRVEVKRQELLSRVKKNVEDKFESCTALANNDEKDLWSEGSKNCIGCGSCTNVCPTCYCLILNDESSAEQFIKIRTYDSCQLYGYARVAGGGTPRRKISQRFRNRVMCKFEYTKSNFNMSACTGCGRCMDACGPGNAFLFASRFVREKEKALIDT